MNQCLVQPGPLSAKGFRGAGRPSFLQAEVVAGGKVLASTDGNGASFTATILKERVQKVQRYSFQRPFSEVYRLAPGYDRWRSGPGFDAWSRPKSPSSRRRRCCPAALIIPITSSASLPGSFPRARSGPALKVDQPWKDRSLTAIGPKLGGYPEKELETIPSLELQTIANATNHPVNQPWTPGESLVLQVQRLADRGFRLQPHRLHRRED